MELEKAIDLKSKVMVLLKACSEVSNYLSIKIDDIQKESGKLSEISDSLHKMRAEHESLEKSVKAMRSEYDSCKKDTEEERRKAKELREGAHAESLAVMKEANQSLASARQKESDVSARLEDVEKLKRELEDKLSAIQKIGGR